jgi:hypothetical protein
METSTKNPALEHDEFIALSEAAYARGATTSDPAFRENWQEVADQWRAMAENLARVK